MIVVLEGLGRGLEEAFSMFWATLWALVLGFGLSGAVQAFVSRARMEAALGDHRPRTIAKASFFGVISSSCSYAASALAKSLFARGADFTASMVFMIASTNLVVELGLMMWLLMGWQFALAEFVGGAVMIAMLAVVLPRAIPPAWLGQAREALGSGDIVDEAHESHESADADRALSDRTWKQRITTRAGWSDAAGYTVSDLTMLRKELVGGFLIAGFLAALVPNGVWAGLFLTGHGFASTIENVVIGPALAIVSFVCSVGNVPLAAALWKGGISFGGVISFVFADLVTLPLLLIYRKYYRTPITLLLLAAFWFTMSVAGLVTEFLFKWMGLVPKAHPQAIVPMGIRLDYTSVLDVVAILGFGYLYWLYRNAERFGGGGGYAKDLVCGMQVQKAMAPARATVGGVAYYFCSDGCRDRFVAKPQRYLSDTGAAEDSPHSGVRVELGRKGTSMSGGPARPEAASEAIDPVCGMTVSVASAAAHAPYAGAEYHFCNPGCRDRFVAEPLRYLDLARDPVCGMDVEVASAPAEATVGGVGYVFCNPGCRDRFVAAPREFVAQAPSGSGGIGG